MWFFIYNMKPFAEKFYKSKAWQNCSKNYSKSVGGLCERCLEKGLIVAGAIVHHKVWLNAENINDPSVSLNWDNLELVCRDCHTAEHIRKKKRFSVDEQGRIIFRE